MGAESQQRLAQIAPFGYSRDSWSPPTRYSPDSVRLLDFEIALSLSTLLLQYQ